MRLRQQSSTSYPINILLINSTDHLTGKTGVSPAAISVTLSKNGGSFTAASGSLTELGNGWYSLAANATDRNTIGELIINASASGADPYDEKIEIVPWNPYDAVRLGLTAIPNVAQGSTGALATGNTLGQPTVAALTTAAKTDVENAVWESLLAAHTTSSTFGSYMQSIGTAVSANDIVSTIASSATIVTGSNTSGSYVDTSTINLTYWITAPVGTAVGGFGLRQRLVFAIGSGRAPLTIKVSGYWNGAGQVCDLYALNNLTTVYDKISNSATALTSRNNDAVYSYGIAREYVDSSGNTTLEFRSASTNTAHRLRLDQVLVYNVNEVATFTGQLITAQNIWSYAGPEGRSLTVQGVDPVTPPTTAQIAAALLVTPANKLATDGSGFVSANNLPSDYQQRSIAVTLPTTPPDGYGGGGATIDTTQIAEALFVNPNNKLLTNIDGSVVAALSGEAPFENLHEDEVIPAKP